MSSTSVYYLEDECGYDCPEDRQQEAVSERVAVVKTRKFTGRERASRASRFSHRPAPQRMSGSHRRSNKRYGI